MFLRSLMLLFLVMSWTKVSLGSDLSEREQDKLDRNLKILRRDFNHLIENVEDFAADFLKQLQDAGMMVGTASANEDDYNWQDDKLTENKIGASSSEDATTTETVNLRLKTSNPNLYKLPAEYADQKELSNEIQKRKKRSVAQNNNFDGPQSAPTDFAQNGQGLPAPMEVNIERRKLPAQILDRRPLTDGHHEEQGNVLGSQQNTKEQANPHNNKNYKGEDQQVCTSKTEKEIDMEKEKLEELKREVKKLNELVGLLKDQQKLISVMDQENMGLANNEIDGDLINNSFLYKTMKQLQNKQKEEREKNTLSENIQGKSYKTNSYIQTKDLSPEISELKLDLRKTAANLNETKEMLIRERQKEESLEGELRRQNSELKFLKVMMENLYDKSNVYPESRDKTKKSASHRGLRNSDFEDIDIDSILGALHAPKPWPTINSDGQTRPRTTKHDLSNVEKYFNNITPQDEKISDKDVKRPSSELDLLFPEYKETGKPKEETGKPKEETGKPKEETGKPKDKDPFTEKLDDFFKKVHEEFIHGPLEKVDKNSERNFLANQTKSALIQMTKHDPDRFKKFNLDTRESDPAGNQDNNMHRLLSILSNQGNSDNSPLARSEPSRTKNSQNHHLNDANKDNGTFLSETARASSGSKTDDVDFKLKLIDMLTNEGRSDDVDNKERRLDEAMKKLMQPEKKSNDDLTLDALMNLVKERQESQKNTQGSLSKLLKNLNTQPQSKSDSLDVESELIELQRAINNLRPKEETGFTSFDLGINNRRGNDQAQDFQAMLNQIITKNGATSNGLGAPSTLNLASTGNVLDKSSLATTQQVLSQLMSPNNAFQVNAQNNGYTNQLGDLQSLIKSYSSSQSNVYGGNGPNPNLYSSMGSNLYGSGTNNAYDGHSYNPNYGNSYSSGLAGYSPNSYGPYSSPVGAYSSNLYQPNSNSYAGGYNQNGYGRTQGYGGNGNYLSPNSQSATQNSYIPNNYAASNPNSNPYASPSYGSPYQPPKASYQSPGYQAGTYPANNQASSSYQSSLSSGKAGYNGVAAQGYAPGGSPGYPGVVNGYKSNYGSGSASGSALDYGKSFFQPGSAAGASYQGYNYGSKSYSGPGLDQPYGNSQGNEQYKYGMISDLTQQIQNLENIITGLNRRGDYSQTPDDKAMIAGLEERIYELKSVISNLNQPSYPAPPQPYAAAAATGPNQAPYNPQHAASYNSRSQYSSSQAQYQPVAPDAQNQPSYSPSESQQGQYLTPNSASYQGSQPNPSSQPNHPPSVPSQASYQSNPQDTSLHGSAPYQAHSGPPSNGGASYQPKESTGEDRTMSRVGHKEIDLEESEEKQERGREKRQVAGGGVPPGVMPEERAYKRIDDGVQDNRHDVGDDALSQIANIFMKYMDDKPTQSQPQLQAVQEGIPSTNQQQMRGSSLDGLQEKLNALKIQLESQKPSERSLHDLLAPPGTFSLAPASKPYGVQNSYSSTPYGDNHIQKSLSSKKKDILSEILIKILEKVISILPNVVSGLFGNLVTEVGDSYGDSYSPLQNILKNLGPIGHFPLILVKVLESVGTILKYLKKNQMFRQLLLPGIVLGLVGGAVFFLIFFFQQDEPYGYISYQGNDANNYPRYEHSDYGNRYHHRDPPYVQNYRSNDFYPNSDIYNNNNNVRRYDIPNFDNRIISKIDANNPDIPLPYFRGYYDYFRDSEGKRVKR